MTKKKTQGRGRLRGSAAALTGTSRDGSAPIGVSVELHDTDRRDAYANLLTGARQRLQSAAWAAQNACQDISKHDHDALAEIERAMKCLTDAARHAKAVVGYQDALNDAIADGSK